MTFVDYYLEKLQAGKCPACGTQVVIHVPGRFQPEVWERATSLPEIRAIVIEALDLSVRTRRTLEKVGIVTVGDLLDSNEARIRRELVFSDQVIEEIGQLLASKDLSLASA